MEMCKLLIDRIFNGNDAVYGLTCQAVEGAIAQHGADKGNDDCLGVHVYVPSSVIFFHPSGLTDGFQTLAASRDS